MADVTTGADFGKGPMYPVKKELTDHVYNNHTTNRSLSDTKI